MLKVGLYGFGNIAQAHKRAYDSCAQEGLPIQLTAACDITEERLKICRNCNDIHTYQFIEDMLKNERLDIIDICLPTYMHADTTIDMLGRGYHVLCEKPMALTYFECVRMLEAAKVSKGKLMIGQCLRFRPEYEYLKMLVDENQYGPVISAYFQRLGGLPLWGWQNWFLDPSKSGGCLQDQHIHDVDMIRYLFGEPLAVNCYTTGAVSRYDCVASRFEYPDNKLVIATSDWGLREGVKFQEEYRINFDKATLIYKDGILKLYKKMRPPIIVKIETMDGIKGEIAHFVNYILKKTDNKKNPPESAAATISLIEKMRTSSDGKGMTVDCCMDR